MYVHGVSTNACCTHTDLYIVTPTHTLARTHNTTHTHCPWVSLLCPVCVIAAAVREMFEKTDFYKTSDKQCLFMTIHDAVLYAQRLLAIAQGVRKDLFFLLSLKCLCFMGICLSLYSDALGWWVFFSLSLSLIYSMYFVCASQFKC